MAEAVDSPCRAEAKPTGERPQKPDIAIRVGDNLADGRTTPQPRNGKPLRRLAEIAERATAVLDTFPPRTGAVFACGQDFAQQRLVPPIKIRRGGGMNGRGRGTGGIYGNGGHGRIFGHDPMIAQERDNDKTMVRTKSYLS